MKILHLFIALSQVFVAYAMNNGNNSNAIPVVKSDSTYKVLVEYDIVYAKGLSHETINSTNVREMPLKLDIYTPDNDIRNRPVFLFIHGGGFAGGTKQQERIIEWAQYFASRGWVFISIDYRLKKHKGTVPQKWIDFTSQLPEGVRTNQFLAMYPAQRDAKAALRWVVTNADTYNINTNYITVGGGSAGAVTAITAGVSNAEDFRDELSDEQDPTLTTTNIEQMYEVRTIIDLWGSNSALYALEQIWGYQRFNSNIPSLFIAHGTEDHKVPFSKAEELKAIYESIEVPFVYYPLQGKGHGCWGAKVKGVPLNILARDFIVEQQGIITE